MQGERRPTTTLRPAQERDADQIAALIATPQDLRQVSPDEEFPLDERTVRHWIRERRAGHVLIERGRVVAYAELVTDSAVRGRLWIGHMMVDPHRRGLGHGQRLVLGLLQIASEERNAREVAISAFVDNPRALQCYRSCGFRDRAQVRVGERELIELRYPIAAQQPVVDLKTAGASVAVGTSVGALSLFGSWNGFDWISALPLLGVLALITWGAHALIPARRHTPALHRWRTTAYALVVGSSALGVALLLHVVRGVDLFRMVIAIGIGTSLALIMMLIRVGRASHPGGAGP